MFEANNRRVVLLAVGTALATFTSSVAGDSSSGGGTLAVRVSGLKHTRGKLVAKLFRRHDVVPKGPGFRRMTVPLMSTRPKLGFRNVPYGEYALFLYHDENDNGTVDHNVLGIPTEPLGFSAGFRPSLWSGLPDFDDLRFVFSKARTTESIVIE